MTRYFGLDIGSRRIGVATSDPDGRVAVPVTTLVRESGRDLAAQLRTLVADYEVEALVVGLPLRTDGTEGPEVAAVRDEAARLAEGLALPLHFADERFSTRIAHGAAATMGADSRRRRGKIDEMAATVILQGFLDREGPGPAQGS